HRWATAWGQGARSSSRGRQGGGPPSRLGTSANTARRADLPSWVAGFPETGVRWFCQPQNTNINNNLFLVLALLPVRPMAPTQSTSTRTVLTGIAVLLAGWLA